MDLSLSRSRSRQSPTRTVAPTNSLVFAAQQQVAALDLIAPIYSIDFQQAFALGLVELAPCHRTYLDHSHSSVSAGRPGVLNDLPASMSSRSSPSGTSGQTGLFAAEKIDLDSPFPRRSALRSDASAASRWEKCSSMAATIRRCSGSGGTAKPIVARFLRGIRFRVVPVASAAIACRVEG